MTRSRSIDDIFEECLELVFKGATIEECLKRYPEDSNDLRGLLETATAAKRAMAVRPRPEFREMARQQMHAALRQRSAEARRPVFAWRWQPRWAVVTAAVLAVLVIGGSTVLASNSSMPDQPLYAVKQATEQVRVVLTPSRVSKATLYAGFADRRVNEIIYLSKKGEAAKLQATTQRLQSDLNNVVVLASTGANYGGVALADHQAARGSTAVPSTTVPPTTIPPALAAPITPPTPATAGNATEKTAPPPPITITTQPAPTITVAVPPAPEARPNWWWPFGGTSDSRASLAVKVKYQSFVDQAQLQAALATASPDVRIALLKAIGVSETGYEKALQSLGQQP